MNASGLSTTGVAEVELGVGPEGETAVDDGEIFGSGSSPPHPFSDVAASATAAAAAYRRTFSTTHLPEIEASRAA
jgi:hypothetical protein